MFISPRQARRGWSDWHLVASILMICVGVGATYDAWVSMWQITRGRGEWRHLALLPLVLFWLAWVRRERVNLCEPRSTWLGPVTVLTGWLLAVFGRHMALEVVWHLGAMVIVVGCLVSVLGLNIIKAFAPVLGALAFVIPLPMQVAQPLARPIEELAATLMQPLLGLPRIAARQAVPDLVCAVLIAYAFAFASPYRRWIRSLLIFISPVAAVVILMVQIMLYRVLLIDRAVFWADWASWLMLPMTLAMLWGLIQLLRWAAVPLQHYKLGDET